MPSVTTGLDRLVASLRSGEPLSELPREVNQILNDLALTGARDMSTIETPPQDRLPVETIVAQYDERVIRDAVQRVALANKFYGYRRVAFLVRPADQVGVCICFQLYAS